MTFFVDPNGIVNCITTYCFTAKFTDKNGTVHVARNCATVKVCSNSEQACSTATKIEGLKACVGACCETDNCNNFTPSSAAGIMVTKFTLVLMVIVGLVA